VTGRLRFGLAVLAALTMSATASGAPSPNSCVSVIRAFNRATDLGLRELFEQVTWEDGFNGPSGPEQRSWNEIYVGAHPRYYTYLRDIRRLTTGAAEEIVSTKEISLSLSGGEYTGDYSVSEERYICHRRGGQWRIFRHEALRTEYLKNPDGRGFSPL
jgi:hypothetical protein